ncbi:tyrosine-type recombinase/integrase [Fusobacterium sp. IOR10]|uniref:tyrosine-type recombinase/integrase n=1 Tax=Fusobacterium sp. IOR10 TaxID=2665157 RepID=UPI0013CF4C6B|nr:tyrosine-type recombinase/integrase [Fusobacterium sp. IOR10]
MSTRKRGDKWYYSFEAAVVDGKRKRIERVGGKTKKEAERALAKALSEYSNNENISPNKISFGDYLDYWYKNYVELNCKYNTQISYLNLIKAVKLELGYYKLKDLNTLAVQTFINKKSGQGYSKSMIVNLITIVSGSLKYACNTANLLKYNPVSSIKIPKLETTKNRYTKLINLNDFKKIMERFKNPNKTHIMIAIGFYTGCRIGEVTALTWNDIDFDKNTISITKQLYNRGKVWCIGTPKTKSSVRTIYFGNILKKILLQEKKEQKENEEEYNEYYNYYFLKEKKIINENVKILIKAEKEAAEHILLPKIDFICRNEAGVLMTSNTFKYPTKVINFELGIPFNFHSLRHTHATLLIEAGANIKAVQKRLGHAKIQTTLDTYTHETDKMSFEARDLFEKLTKD